MAPRKKPQPSTAKPKSAPRTTRNSNTAGNTKPPAQEVGALPDAVQPKADINPFAPQDADGDRTPTAGRIGTRTSNTTKHPGDAQNTYTQRRRTPQEMEAARKQDAERQEKQEAERLVLLRRIAELEWQLADNEPFGATPRAIIPAAHQLADDEPISATPRATIPAARRLRRTETYLEIPSSDAEEKNAMEVDQTDREDFKLDSEEEATEKEDELPKKKVTVLLGKRKATAKGNRGGDETEGQKDEDGKKKKKSRTKVRDEIDGVREQIVKARNERNEGAEVTRVEPVVGEDSARQSLIDQQGDGGKSAASDRDPKGYVPQPLFSPSVMLTLDETTLFYYSLSLSKGKKFSSLIQEWADFVDNTTKPKVSNSTCGSTSTTLASTSTRATKVSPLNDHVAIISRVREEVPKSAVQSNADLSVDSVSGGLADEEELQGAERDEAINSPPKGKVRATSAVSHYISDWLIHILIY